MTFRLADSVPQSKLAQWIRQRQAWLQQHPPPWSEREILEYQLLFSEQIDHWLDAGYGNCWLRFPHLRDFLVSAMQFFDGDRYWLGTFSVMPNHVHALVTPLGNWSVGRIIGSWKIHSGREINRAVGRSGRLWAVECFDHIVRNETQLERFRRYILENPVKASLPDGSYFVGEGKACRREEESDS